MPQWSLDGSKIVFNRGAVSIFTVASDGSSLKVVAKGKAFDDAKTSPSISPDGSRVAYSQFVDSSLLGVRPPSMGDKGRGH